MSQIEKKVLCLGSESLILRNPTSEDAADLIGYAKRTMSESEFNVTEPDEFKMTEEEERAWIQRLNEAPQDVAIVAEINGAIVGMLSFQCRKQRRLSHSGSFGMGVVKEHWGKGIGNALLACLIQWAKMNPGVKKIGLAVLSNNERAIHLYRKHGFIEEGKRIKEVQLRNGEFIDDYLMYRWID